MKMLISIILVLAIHILSFSAEIRKIEKPYEYGLWGPDDPYCLLYKYKSQYDKHLIFNDYYIARFNYRQPYIYEILDSIVVSSMHVPDTNKILFVTADEYRTQLILMKLSPVMVRDTLLSIINTDSSNWLNLLREIEMEYYSINDSILVYKSGQTSVEKTRVDTIQLINGDFINITNTEEMYRRNINILRILPCSKKDELAAFKGIFSMNATDDVSQIIICTTDSTRLDIPSGSVLIYDVQLDSIIHAKELGESNVIAKRRYRDSDFYYVKEIGDTWNLWRYSYKKGTEKLTDYEYPWHVVSVLIHDNYIQYVIRNMDVYELRTEFISLENEFLHK